MLSYHARLKKLEKEKRWSDLDKMNQQVNPHFLFNTLNTLSSLVTEDPGEADRFLNQMSGVYRYLLDNSKHELVTLETEMSFIHSFFHLLELRFSGGVVLDCAIDNAYAQWLLPPLTLQLLVENAVKHNQTTRSVPLRIEIKTTLEGRLLVCNNLQAKNQKPVSHNIGLSTIARKYALMQQPAPAIANTNGFFNVSIPLIHPDAARQISALRIEESSYN